MGRLSRKSENRSIVEIANQRNIGHDAPAGWKLPFIGPMLLNVLVQTAQRIEDLAVELVVGPQLDA